MNFPIRGAVSTPGGISLTNDGFWLHLPQALVVEARRDIAKRSELLKRFRDEHGRVRGVNEKTMREVRQLASPAMQRGGAPRHYR